jgi:hypothetical protein
MSSFFNQLSQVETDTPEQQHHNRHAVPTPVEVAAVNRLLQDQYYALLQTGDNPNADFLNHLIEDLQRAIDSPPEKVAGVPQSYLDALERVPKKLLKESDSCPICGEAFLDDPYPLVVELPCHKTHRFDLDCVGPWLRLNGTCPLDRKDLMKKKEVVKAKDDEDEEEEDYEGMYA